MNRFLLTALLVLTACSVTAQQPVPGASSNSPRKTARDISPGERAFNANCSRCHTAPEQLPRRITGTVVQHMRVHALLSAADQKALLHYLAP